MLVRNGASLKIDNSSLAIGGGDTTPLYEAVNGGHLDIVKFLVDEVGVDVEKGFYGFTPLYAAAKNSYVDIFKFLLSKGANIEICKNLFYQYNEDIPIKIKETYPDMFKDDFWRKYNFFADSDSPRQPPPRQSPPRQSPPRRESASHSKVPQYHDIKK